MAITNLDQYYSNQGKALPSLQERATIFETSGLGSASAYSGSAEQNALLLNKLSAAPAVTEIPGVGTMTVTPKMGTPNVPVSPPVDQNTAGLYERTGVTPPPATTFENKNYGRIGNDVYEVMPDGTQRYVSSSEASSKLQGLNLETLPQIGKVQAPVYKPQANPDSKYAGISKSYADAATKLATLEAELLKSRTPSDEEKALLKQVQEKRKALAMFDVETLKKIEGMSGTGRGQTLGFVAKNQEKERRTAALEKLGMSTEAQFLVDALGDYRAVREEQRQSVNDQISMLDRKLGLEDKLLNLKKEEADDARNYILDVIEFADGKSFDELDEDTKQAIVNEVAKTPLTLDMIRSSMERAKEEKFVTEAGKLRDDSRAVLSTILQQFEGKSFGELDKASQDELMKLAANAGFPTSLLISGMQAVKTEVLRKRAASGDGSSTALKFSQDERQKLIGEGFTATEIDQIQKDLNANGLNSVIDGLPDNQKRVLQTIVKGSEPNKEFLNKDYFKTVFTTDQLNTSAKDAGFKTGGFLGIGKKGDSDAYLNYLDKLVVQYRQAGYSDQEILKMMQ